MTAAQKEDLRREVRNWLAERAALPFNASMIHRGVSRLMPCTVPEVEDACLFLLDISHVQSMPREISAVKYFKIHAKGALAHEAGD